MSSGLQVCGLWRYCLVSLKDICRRMTSLGKQVAGSVGSPRSGLPSFTRQLVASSDGRLRRSWGQTALRQRARAQERCAFTLILPTNCKNCCIRLHPFPISRPPRKSEQKQQWWKTALLGNVDICSKGTNTSSGEHLKTYIEHCGLKEYGNKGGKP